VSREASNSAAEFDQYASNYDAELAKGIAISGEDKNYFARQRVEWLRGLLKHHHLPSPAVMEFGCGAGSNLPFLIKLLAAGSVVGVDISSKSLELARSSCGSEQVRLLHPNAYAPCGNIDLVFCNGVFHHISPAERPSWVSYIFRSLKAGGLFALWENNPWNPAMLYAMSRISFDRDAKTLNPPEARKLVKAAGFEVVRTDFLFIFPRALACFRLLEPPLARVPLGAQYQVLARKPG
jgi:SAM-dependent methyltransferase